MGMVLSLIGEFIVGLAVRHDGFVGEEEGIEIEKTKIKSKILPATKWNSVLVSMDEGEIYFLANVW